MADCIFCKIVKGEISCDKVYEDQDFLVFLDINPQCEGHMLIIPKKHWPDIFEIPSNVLKDLIALAQKIAKRLKSIGYADGIDLLHASDRSAQQSVFHFHLHLAPRKTNDGLDLSPHGGYQKGDLENLGKKLNKILAEI